MAVNTFPSSTASSGGTLPFQSSGLHTTYVSLNAYQTALPVPTTLSTTGPNYFVYNSVTSNGTTSISNLVLAYLYAQTTATAFSNTTSKAYVQPFYTTNTIGNTLIGVSIPYTPSAMLTYNINGTVGDTYTNYVAYDGPVTGTTTVTMAGIAYLNGKVIAGGSGTLNNTRIYTSTATDSNGAVSTWSTATVTGATNWLNLSSAAYGNGLYVVGSTTNVVAYSTNATTWSTAATYGSAFPSNSLVYGNGIFAMRSSSTTAILTSTNATTWSTSATISAAASSSFQNSLCFHNGYFIAGDNSGNITYSTNCVSWSTVASGASGTSIFRGATYCKGIYYALFYDGASTNTLTYSTNLTTWTNYSSGLTINTFVQFDNSAGNYIHVYGVNPSSFPTIYSYIAGSGWTNYNSYVGNNSPGNYIGSVPAVDSNGGFHSLTLNNSSATPVSTTSYMRPYAVYNNTTYPFTISAYSGQTPTATI